MGRAGPPPPPPDSVNSYSTRSFRITGSLARVKPKPGPATSLSPLARAHDAGLGVIAKEVFANGRLTDANRLPGDESLVRGLRAAAGARSCSIDQLALAFVLSHPFVDVALSGAATSAQLASHTAALDVALDDGARALLEGITEPAERYWATRARLPWS